MTKKYSKTYFNKKNTNFTKTFLGLLFITNSVILFLSFYSFLLHWKEDQSQLENFLDKSIIVKNIFGKVGAFLGDFFIYKSIGIGAFTLPILFFLTGLKFWKIYKFCFRKFFLNILFFSIFLPLSSGFIFPKKTILVGIIGFEINEFLNNFIGNLGLGMLLFISLISYIILLFKINPQQLIQLKKDFLEEKKNNLDKHNIIKNFSFNDENLNIYKKLNFKKKNQNILKECKEKKEFFIEMNLKNSNKKNNTIEKLQKEIFNKDFIPPTIELLKLLKVNSQDITINKKELESNKDKIVETLKNYKIGIKKIKATIGPSITLYEIIPQDGIRISKIKGLENDIALNLSALGIRIIAPIPGRGTIGIEVPNSNRSLVFIHSVLSSKEFQCNKMELPIVLGKTISNKTFIADLTKMPHLLMSGATGQGKSVCLNVIIVALLYKKSPKNLKFIMIDPKKIELSLYKKIERYYLAKLPNTEESIITNTSQAKDVLNSLCKEMDYRYDLLKQSMVRNIKEYNYKNGYMPYIILIIDEFADLIMSSGREIEVYIIRLTQLARAVGIHLIIATQRPSVNIITGLIKANFPARIAFKVSSKIDSRTILDSCGAEQLIGKGDMLFSNGNELIRLQCPFIETNEVEKIVNFYENKKINIEQLELPKPDQQEIKKNLSLNSFKEYDPLFNEAARLVITTQQGSISLLQRKLSIGYARASKIIDQLEENGILGSLEGSKARQVLLSDIKSLQILYEKNKNFL